MPAQQEAWLWCGVIMKAVPHCMRLHLAQSAGGRNTRQEHFCLFSLSVLHSNCWSVRETLACEHTWTCDIRRLSFLGSAKDTDLVLFLCQDRSASSTALLIAGPWWFQSQHQHFTKITRYSCMLVMLLENTWLGNLNIKLLTLNTSACNKTEFNCMWKKVEMSKT